MRKICIINRKGGVAKTTTTAHLALGLARAGRRVLIIDLDPQGNISQSFGFAGGETLYNFLIENKPFHACSVHIEENLTLLPANETLTKAETILAGETAREHCLMRKLEDVREFDYVFLDCPPSLGLLNQNALLYAREAIIPTSTDPLGLDALKKMVEAIGTINELFNHELKIGAIVPTLHDARLKVCRETLGQIQANYYDVVTHPIRIHSKLKEAPGAQQTMFDYDKYGRGAKDYGVLVSLLLQQETQKVPVEMLVTQTI